jgi:glycosyltransferase involved in cell wall biosynthesis
MKLRLLFVVTSMRTGGAETMLLKLVEGLDKSKFLPTVLVLAGRTPLVDKLEQAGALVRTLGVSGVLDTVRAPVRLLRIAREVAPDLIQGWMVHGNVAALFAGVLLGIPFVWGVRHSRLGAANEKFSTRALVYLMKYVSRLPKSIVYNSVDGRSQHEAMGYRATRSVVIPNGFDLSRFVIDPSARQRFRSRYGIPSGCTVIGMVARYHPMKDHDTFLRAASILHRSNADVLFVLVGQGCDSQNEALNRVIKSLGLVNSVLLLGERADICEIANGLDVGSLSSSGEGFSNAIGEIMACGVPCVVTRVGDSDLLIDETGLCVRPGNPEELAQAWHAMIDMGPNRRSQLGLRARARVKELFAIESVVEIYQRLYINIASRNPRGESAPSSRTIERN